MKGLYIAAVVLAPLMGVTSIYYLEEWHSALRASFSGYIPNTNHGVYSVELVCDVTQQGSAAGLLFTVFYILLYSFTFKHIRTSTAKVMSIIGLCFSGLVFLVTLFAVANPGAVFFDEYVMIFVGYALIMLAFSIVNLVQATRFKQPVKRTNDVIDDFA
jgi:hypothetical protein